jgi:hypothetical protein
MNADWVRFLMVSLDMEINPRFYRGKKKSGATKKSGELGTSRKTLKKEEPLVK